MHEPEFIEIIGARANNLKDISLKIPRNKLVVFTGLSGSGKSSLAFDTIYAEGQRRYIETFSAYARQFLGQMERPDVEKIHGLSPVISIEQKTTNKNPRSTVGTITEIYDFLRLLFARLATAYSYETGKPMVKYSEDQMIDHLTQHFNNKKVLLLGNLVRGRKGHYRELFDQIRKQGYTKVRVDGEMLDLVPQLQVDRYKVHDIEVVVDRIKVDDSKRNRIARAVQNALSIGNGLVMVHDTESKTTHTYSKSLMCPDTGISYEEPSPNSFSFNSPYGACSHCSGLGIMKQVDLKKIIPDDSLSIADGGLVPVGVQRSTQTFKQLKSIAKKYAFKLNQPIKNLSPEALEVILKGENNTKKAGDVNDLSASGLIKMLENWHETSSSDKIRTWAGGFMSETTCPSCDGARLKIESLHFKLSGYNIAQLTIMDLVELKVVLEQIEGDFNERQHSIGKDLLKELKLRIGFLVDVGLEYLNLDRPAATLSGGESQRIRLATQIGSKLSGITYILDEPSIGLHPRDNQRLIKALRELVLVGNSVIVVEHDKEIMLASDHVVDIGPGAGKRGGEIVAFGKPLDLATQASMTTDYLFGKKEISVPKNRRAGNGKWLEIKGATGHNLQNVHIKIPLGAFTCITGVSGSGKSTLINETLYPILMNHFYKSSRRILPYKEVNGLEHLDKVIEIDQSPIGRTPRSNPATYTNLFTEIRKLFSEVPEAKIRGYQPGRFSFNVKGGRCDVCEGGGKKVIEMNFLPDVYVDCDKCMGRRYNRETLEILYKGKSISDVLDMTVEEAAAFFEHIPKIYRKLKTLLSVGLGYIQLGQSATTLSGGEAQRVKLSEELSKKATGKTIYILDEPTTGLHFEDVKHLIEVLNQLVEKGNTVLVIEHDLDMVKVADYIVDIGPEGGRGGGKIIAEGTPEQIAKKKNSYTGVFLKKELLKPAPKLI